MKNHCKKCNGAGWLWGYELDHPSVDTYNDTMTKYTCDQCHASQIIEYWTWTYFQYDCDFKKRLNNAEENHE